MTFLLQQDQKNIRSAIAVGAIVIAVLLLSLATAARHAYDLGKQRYTLAYEDLQWITSQKTRIDNARSIPARQINHAGHSLISIVTNAAEEHGVLLSRYKPDGELAVQLWTENSPLHATLDWIKDLQNKHHLSVMNMSLGRGDMDGFCKLQIELQSKGQDPI